MIYKCKMCGGNLEISENIPVVECAYCGTNQTVPNADNERKLNLFNRANRLRMLCDFERAANLYESIIAEFPEEAEAYWCLCLCIYGIEYVDDPLTGKKIPTCHRGSFTKITDDENFKAAMNYADIPSRMLYTEEAGIIDRINADILEISKNESPYDIFICYKETDNEGRRTVDSVIAQNLYDMLTDKGYKVFFARITLEQKVGERYEPYIFAALNSAKIMLCIGTDPEYFRAIWVKNEWGRFLRLAAKNKEKKFFPCYKNMDPYDMPEEFNGLQAQDLSKMGVEQDILRGVEKILGKTNNAERVVSSFINNQTEITIQAMFERVKISLEENDYQAAVGFCEQILNISPKDANAYLYKLVADNKLQTPEELETLTVDIAQDMNYQRAYKFGSDELKERLDYYNRCTVYNRAYNEYKRVNGLFLSSQENSYMTVARKFDKMGDFKDAKELKQQCLEAAQQAKQAHIEAEQKAQEKAIYLQKKAVFDAACQDKKSKGNTIPAVEDIISRLETVIDFPEVPKTIAECYKDIIALYSEQIELNTKKRDWLKKNRGLLYFCGLCIMATIVFFVLFIFTANEGYIVNVFLCSYFTCAVECKYIFRLHKYNDCGEKRNSTFKALRYTFSAASLKPVFTFPKYVLRVGTDIARFNRFVDRDKAAVEEINSKLMQLKNTYNLQ